MSQIFKKKKFTLNILPHNTGNNLNFVTVILNFEIISFIKTDL